jgi:ribonuclease HI
VYGKKLSSIHYPNTQQYLFIEHWRFQHNHTLSSTSTPRSFPTILLPCEGCSLHYLYYVGSLKPKCIIKISYSKATNITLLSFSQRQRILGLSQRRTNMIQIAKHSHPYYRLLAYNDFLVQHNLIAPSSNFLAPIPGNNSLARKNLSLIDRLFDHDDIKKQFSLLDFYTDGSYKSDAAPPESLIGYGWTTSNLPGINVSYNGALEYFPSSTKAETMAILTVLTISPANSLINIFTDSQTAIDSFYKSSNLTSISPRRYNKINNNILWSAIHFVIKELNIKISLHKVKAHSDNHFSDIADAQAKIGRLAPVRTNINYRNLPNQTSTILWNKTTANALTQLQKNQKSLISLSKILKSSQLIQSSIGTLLTNGLITIL